MTLETLRKAKKDTIRAMMRFGVAHPVMKYPVFITTVIFIFIYNVFLHTLIQVHVHEKLARVMAAVLSFAVFFTGMDLTALAVQSAGKQEKTYTVIGFTALSEEVADQSVPVGTAVEELNLPEALAAYGIQNQDDSDNNSEKPGDEDDTVSGNEGGNGEDGTVSGNEGEGSGAETGEGSGDGGSGGAGSGDENGGDGGSGGDGSEDGNGETGGSVDAAGSGDGAESDVQTTNVTLFAKWLPKTDMPMTVGISYRDETLTKLEPGTVYLIEGKEVTASAEGTVPIDESWFGKKISIARRGDGTNTGDSDALKLTVPDRPAGPTKVQPKAESAQDAKDGRLTKTDTTMQYRKKGSTEWITIAGGEITNLEPGDYELRYVSTDTAFSSKIVVKTVKKYSPPEKEDGGSDGTKPDADTKPEEYKIPGHIVVDDRIVPEDSDEGTGIGGASGSSQQRADGNESWADAHPYAVGKILKTLTIPVNKGEVIVTVNNMNETLCTAQAADAVAVANAVLSQEHISRVSEGETIEIRIDVERIDERVSSQDKDLIGQGIENAQEEVPGLTIGMYVDISMFLRRGEGEWSAVHEIDEPIEIVIDQPEELREFTADFYIMRAHEGECTLLPDLDDAVETITIETERFSTYAIAYRLTDVKAGRCGLCHICPTFLGICYFIWLILITASAAFVAIVILRRGKEEKDNKEIM